MVNDLGEVLSEYRDPDRDDWNQFVLPVLRQMLKADLAAAVGIHPRKIAAIRNGYAAPRRRHQAALQQAAGDFARQRLRSLGRGAPLDPLGACRTLLEG